MKKFDLVVAADSALGIGKEQKLPWRLPGDLSHFKEITTGTQPGSNAVIMGRKTWQSLPPKSQPLKDRINVVISRQEIELPTGVRKAGSFEEALAACADAHECFVIGGAEIYRLALQHKDLGRAHITEIEGNFECDVFLPDYRNHLKEIACSDDKHENGVAYRFKIFVPKKA